MDSKKVARLAEFENPISGERGDVLSLEDWLGTILGWFVLFAGFGLGGSLYRFIAAKVGAEASTTGIGGFFSGLLGGSAAAKPAASSAPAATII